MKKIFLAFVAGAMMLAACNKEDLAVVSSDNEVVSATLPDETTRTKLNGRSVRWANTDHIAIFYTVNDNPEVQTASGEIATGANTTSATFNVTFDGENPQKVAAMYPYQLKAVYDGTNTISSINMPQSYDYSGGDISGAPMAVQIEDNASNFAFKNAGALMAITVNNIPAGYKQAILESKIQKIAGLSKIVFNQNGEPELINESTNDKDRIVAINFNPSNELTNKTFYFPIPLGEEYEELTFSINDGNNTKTLKSAGLEAERNKIYTSTLTLDVVTGNLPATANSAAAATEALSIDGASSVNVTIPSTDGDKPTISLPNSYNPTTLSFTSIADNKIVTVQAAGGATDVSDNVNINASNESPENNNFDINLPNSTVTLGGISGEQVTYESVTAHTSANTLVINSEVTVKNLIIKGGNVRVFGNIENISRHGDNEDKVYIIKEPEASLPETITDENIIIIEEPEATVNGTPFPTLAEALDAAKSGDEVKLLRKIFNVGTTVIENKSLTIDLNGQTLKGKEQYLIRILNNGDENIEFTIKNGIITNSSAYGRCVETRSGNITLNLIDVNLDTSAGTGNTQTLTIGGNGENIIVNIEGSQIVANQSGYAVINYNKSDIEISSSTLAGYAALYFKAANNSTGSNGTECSVFSSRLVGDDANPYHETNNFSTIAIEDSGVTVNVNVDSEVIANAGKNKMAFVKIAAGVTNTNIAFRNPVENLHLNGDNAMPLMLSKGQNGNDASIENNTVRFPKAYGDTLTTYGWTISEPDDDGLISITG